LLLVKLDGLRLPYLLDLRNVAKKYLHAGSDESIFSPFKDAFMPRQSED
jgi:hypothetical protein